MKKIKYNEKPPWGICRRGEYQEEYILKLPLPFIWFKKNRYDVEYDQCFGGWLVYVVAVTVRFLYESFEIKFYFTRIPIGKQVECRGIK